MTRPESRKGDHRRKADVVEGDWQVLTSHLIGLGETVSRACAPWPIGFGEVGRSSHTDIGKGVSDSAIKNPHSYSTKTK